MTIFFFAKSEPLFSNSLQTFILDEEYNCWTYQSDYDNQFDTFYTFVMLAYQQSPSSECVRRLQTKSISCISNTGQNTLLVTPRRAVRSERKT